jgi:putative transposase
LIQKRDDLSVRRQCSLLGINRATLYYKGKEPDEAARLFRERVMARIDYWHTRMPAIGSRKSLFFSGKKGLM